MIVRVPDLGEEVRRVEFEERAIDLNEVLAASPGWAEQYFEKNIRVDVEVYRRGTDVYLSGHLAGSVRAMCSRCLDEFSRVLYRDFRFLIVRRAGGNAPEDGEGIDHYTGEELDLGPLVREQALLALETSLLCSGSCKGMCAGCGANLNHEACRCELRAKNGGSRK